MNVRIICIGDVVGITGRVMLQKHLKNICEEYKADAVIVNGENAADGRGITPKIMEYFKHLKVNVVTSGNHIWAKKEIVPYLQSHDDLLRPANFPPECPGVGITIFETKGNPIAVINLQGRVFMKEYVDCPFKTVDTLLTFIREKTKTIIIDFHAETTAEKACLGFYLDGRVSALFGTHTHVQTADERILPKGTAFITDLGMVGALNSSIGMKADAIIHQLMTQMPVRFSVETQGPALLSGIFLEIDTHTGKALTIERIRIVDEHIVVEEKE